MNDFDTAPRVARMIKARTVLAIVLLFGVYLLALLATGITTLWTIACAVSVQEYFAGSLAMPSYLFLLNLVGCLAALVAVIGGLVAVGRAGTDNDAVPVTEQDAPELWTFVKQVAAEADVRPPAELRLNGEVNASISEDARLLGLWSGRRRLTLGLPLLAALSANELRALLGHEFGHYSGGHTRVIVHRGYLALIGLQKNLVEAAALPFSPAGLFSRVIHVCTRLYAWVSFAARRHQEFEADAVAARLAGPTETAQVLRSLAGIDARWQVFHEHLSRTAAAGHAPEDPLAMFALMLAERPVEVTEPRRHDPYAAHPGTADRLTRLAAMSAEIPAHLDEPATWTYPRRDLLWHLLPNHDFDALPAAQWLDQAARQTAPPAAARTLLDDPDATLATVLDLLESGQTEALAGRFGSVDRYRAMARLCEALHALVGHYLVEAGSAHWRLSWTGPSELVVGELRADGVHLRPFTELNGVVFDAVDHHSGVERLRQHLASHRVDPKHRPAVDTASGTVDTSRKDRDNTRKAALFTLYVAALVAVFVVFVLTDQSTDRPVTGTTVLPTYTPPATRTPPVITFQLPPELYSSLFPKPLVPEPSVHTETPQADTDGNP